MLYLVIIIFIIAFYRARKFFGNIKDESRRKQVFRGTFGRISHFKNCPLMIHLLREWGYDVTLFREKGFMIEKPKPITPKTHYQIKWFDESKLLLERPRLCDIAS